MLFGCHHLPQMSPAKTCVVVLCHPIGQEYISSHRAFYLIAVRLSQAGFHVLRFDYFGCGDSNGDFEQGTLLQWTTDIHTAIGEVQNRSGLTSVCLIGLRIGATLALKAAGECPHSKSIVLWEPILDGKLYLRELDQKQRKFVAQYLRGRNESSFTFRTTAQEVVGFPMTSKLRQDLQMMEADHLELRTDVKSLFVFNRRTSKSINRLQAFAQEHSNSDFQLIEDHRVWEEESRFRLTPFKTLNYVVNWIARLNS